jgi:hypothetical protein
LLTILGKDDVPAIWGKAVLQFIAGKILNRYNYRFYSAQKKMVKDSITAKREGEAGCDGDTPDEKKKRTPRLPEKYCVNKKKRNAPATHSYFRTFYYKNVDYHGLFSKISQTL